MAYTLLVHVFLLVWNNNAVLSSKNSIPVTVRLYSLCYMDDAYILAKNSQYSRNQILAAHQPHCNIILIPA